MTGRLLLTASLLLSGGLLWAAPPNPVVLPPPIIPLAFSHTSHLKLGMKCMACHDNVLRSIDSADDLMPKQAVCAKCHQIEAPDPSKVFPKSTCATCHPGAEQSKDTKPAEVQLPPPRLRFTHRAHGLLGIVCADCHGDMRQVSHPARTGWVDGHMPTMATCIRCHDGASAPNACPTCHLTEDDGRILTAYPEGRLAPTGRFRDDDHRDPAWNYRHGVPARDEAYCQGCHTTKDCLACHAGAQKPRDIHPGNWIALHSREALARSAECLGCHEGGVDCYKCHQASGVTQAEAICGGPVDPSTGACLGSPRPATSQIHPSGWASFGAGPNLHGPIARTSIDSCVSCHTEQECIQCHSDRTIRVNPHPPGFNGSNLQGRNDAVCRKCHDVIP